MTNLVKINTIMSKLPTVSIIGKVSFVFVKLNRDGAFLNCELFVKDLVE